MSKVDDWTEWLEHIELDVRGLLFSRIIYRDLGAMVRENPALQKPSHFYDFLARAYADHIASGVRRQVDEDRRTHSLLRLLREIARKPEYLSRQRYEELVVDDSKSAELRELDRKRANREFDDRHGPGAKHFDPAQAEEDEQRLLDISAGVVDHVNSHVAHLNAEARQRRPATFEQLDAALDSLDGLVKKYRLELEAVTLLDPVLAGPWTEIFSVPWVVD